MAPSATQSILDVADSVAQAPTPRPDINTNATRHLSAGAYLDPEFCLTALGEVYYKPKRVVAPSYGFDAITVLGHCLRARRALLVRDALLIGLILLASWVSVVALLVVLLAMLAVHLLLVSCQVVWDALRYLRALPDADDAGGDRDGKARRDLPPGFRRLWFENILAQIFGRMLVVAIGYLMFLLGGAALSIFVWHAGVTGTRFGVSSSVTIGTLVALACLVPAGARAWSRFQLRALVPERVPRPPMTNRRLLDIDHQMVGNRVIYSGYEPFVGSGVNVNWWTLALRLVRPNRTGLPVPEVEREFDRPPFTAPEITAYVRRHIAGLAHDPVPERRLSHLTVADRVFVAGTEVSDLELDLPADEVTRIIRHPTAPERHYLACQVVSWRGELVTTVYVHFAVQGKVLYVELHVRGLPPCDERYRVVDQIEGTSLGRVLCDAGHGLLTAPGALVGAPVRLVRAGSDMITLAVTRPTATMRVRRGYDYGAKVGLREIGASPDTRDHIQTQDIVKYGRMIERRVHDAVLDFLEDKGVDVTEYRQRALTILNAGAVATAGGTVNVNGDVKATQNVNTDGGSE